ARVGQGADRAEGLEAGLRRVAAVRALPRAEELGVAADVQDVGVPGDRPVAGALRQHPEVGLLVERDRTLAAQRREGALALHERTLPEQRVGEVDLVDGEDFAALHRGSSGAGARPAYPVPDSAGARRLLDRP